MTRAELKRDAKSQLRGNWGWAICLFLVGAVISMLVTSINTVWLDPVTEAKNIETASQVLATNGAGWIEFVLGLVVSMILWGITYTILQFTDTGEKEQVFKGAFSAFTGGRFKNSFLTMFVMEIFNGLWYLLLIIPGIVKSYSYSMTPYIMKDMFDSNKDMTITEAITASRRLMNGHKAELFILDLSFWGWDILGILTFGIGFLWITPYYRQTKANFYRNLAGKKFLEK